MQVRYGAELRAVRQGDAVVELELADGSRCRAPRAVLALPRSTCCRPSALRRGSPAATAEALGTNAGRAHKVWLRARGVPAGRARRRARGRGCTGSTPIACSTTATSS